MKTDVNETLALNTTEAVIRLFRFILRPTPKASFESAFLPQKILFQTKIVW